jgi:type IV pilus assembly protein PilX
MRSSTRNGQSGAVLFLALIMLLVVTVLAISSFRGVTLESRITANQLIAKRLNNAAEAGLRVGESSILSLARTPDINATCTSTLCLPYANASAANGYTSPRFGTSDAKTSYSMPDSTTFDSTIQWYTVPVGSTCVEDNCALTGKGGAFFYEVNSCAGSCASSTTDQRTMLRTVIAKIFN